MLVAVGNKPYFDYNISDNQKYFLYCFIPTLIIFVIFTLIPAIKSCTIVGKLNEINKEINISSLKNINKIFIIFSLSLYGIILLFILIICLYKKIKEMLTSQKKDENKNVNKNVNDTTITNNNVTESNTGKNI